MRFYSYNEYCPGSLFGEDVVITVSESDIRRQYWPYWYERMCQRFGKLHVDNNYSFEDCLDDWIVVNWAWEIKNEH